MKRKKIFNDPVYGFISVPYGLLFELIEHPYFQRLRRIKQVSLTHYVYPGALHTRFHHALGAVHLMGEAIDVLCSKGVAITDEEAESVCAAILLHDIGHGPFSHTLEHTLINIPHEELSALFMERLNEVFAGRLELAIRIFRDEYHKPFLHQLVSGQLDMDRVDYLTRDSFFTGVYEGVIGYDRIIKMLDVHDGELVVEEKGIYSIEKFLMARRLMYWQVYLHKTVLAAEQMLIQTMRRAKDLAGQGADLQVTEDLGYFLYNTLTSENVQNCRDQLLTHFAALDDHDIVSALKVWRNWEDPVLAYLSNSLIDRRLFRLKFRNKPATPGRIENIRQKVQRAFHWPAEAAAYCVITGSESNRSYSTAKDEIQILLKNGKVKPMSQVSDHGVETKIVTKYYLSYPKGLDE